MTYYLKQLGASDKDPRGIEQVWAVEGGAGWGLGVTTVAQYGDARTPRVMVQLDLPVTGAKAFAIRAEEAEEMADALIRAACKIRDMANG